jgi:hypothetical protein
VITGFNTDVTYDGVTYHVQTEDKGVETALILSLVYERGVILAAKRSPYDDLVEAGFDIKVLEDRLQRQHKLICAAISAGRLEDLKKMSAKTVGVAPAKEANVDFPGRIPMPSDDPVWDISFPEEDAESVADAFERESAAPEPAIIEADQVLVVDGGGPLAPLNDNRLRLKLIGREKFLTGERKNLNVLVCRGSEEATVGGASVMIKILGSDFRPLIYHAKADGNGIAAVMVKIPNFRSGRAAILIRAIFEGEEAELRRVVSHQEQ